MHGNTQVRPRANEVSPTRESARKVDWLDRSGAIDVPGLQALPGKLGKGCGLTQAKSHRRHCNPVDQSDKLRLVLADLAREQHRIRTVQLVYQLAHRAVSRRMDLHETFGAGLIPSPHQPTS